MANQDDSVHPSQDFCDFLKTKGWMRSENLVMSVAEMEQLKALWKEYRGGNDDTLLVMPPAQQEHLFRSLEKFR